MTNIAVCICTRRRTDELLKLLDSIEQLIIPVETIIKIIVVENDIKNNSEYIVKKYSSKSKFSYDYFLETRQGIVYARNKSVEIAGESDFCCFVDDDQIVDLKYIDELLKCQREFNADGVSGSTPPRFTRKVPEYIEHFHTRKTYTYGTIRESANTGCLLLRKDILDRIEGPFDLRFNFSGGEDSHLTSTITRMGGVIRHNPNAIAYEIIQDDRVKVRYVINRSFRIANSLLLINSIENDDFSKIKTLPRLLMRLFYGLLVLIPILLFGKKSYRLEGLIKISRALGGLFFLLGHTNKFYKLHA